MRMNACFHPPPFLWILVYWLVEMNSWWSWFSSQWWHDVRKVSLLLAPHTSHVFSSSCTPSFIHSVCFHCRPFLSTPTFPPQQKNCCMGAQWLVPEATLSILWTRCCQSVSEGGSHHHPGSVIASGLLFSLVCLHGTAWLSASVTCSSCFQHPHPQRQGEETQRPEQQTNYEREREEERAGLGVGMLALKALRWERSSCLYRLTSQR